jgi:hypothetical protein
MKIKSPPNGLRSVSVYPSLIVALAVFLINLGRLAVSPQTGDGAEQIMTALQGGVLHPPGFPVQAWLNRVLIHFPVANPATRLALGSLFAHSASVFLISDSLRILGAGAFGCVAAALGYGFFPPSWYQALQPEVFGLTYFFLSLLYYLTLKFSFKSSLSIKEAIVFGVALGLSASQHLILVCAAPVILVGLSLLYTRSKKNLKFPCFSVGLAGLLTLALYGSLPLLRNESTWPNWGDLSTFKGWLTHLLREEYGTFNLMANNAQSQWNGLQILSYELLENWAAFALAAGSGMWSLIRMSDAQRRRPLCWAFFGSLAVGSLFLVHANAIQDRPIATSILERFQGLVVIPLSILSGIGFDFASRHIKRTGFRVGSILAALIGLFLLMIGNWNRTNCSEDNTSDVYLKTLSETMPQNSVYIGHSDMEGFYGIPVNGGKRRFPIDESLLAADWYKKRVLPALEPRLSFPVDLPLTMQKVTEEALQKGMVIVSAHSALGRNQKGKSELRGLYFYSDPYVDALVTRQTAEMAIKICPYLKDLGALPSRGHEVSRENRRVGFARAFHGATEYFKSSGQAQLMVLSHQIAESLTAAHHPKEWNSACDQLTQLWAVEKSK